MSSNSSPRQRKLALAYSYKDPVPRVLQRLCLRLSNVRWSLAENNAHAILPCWNGPGLDMIDREGFCQSHQGFTPRDSCAVVLHKQIEETLCFLTALSSCILIICPSCSIGFYGHFWSSESPLTHPDFSRPSTLPVYLLPHQLGYPALLCFFPLLVGILGGAATTGFIPSLPFGLEKISLPQGASHLWGTFCEKTLSRLRHPLLL